jgi:hypothetical protein
MQKAKFMSSETEQKSKPMTREEWKKKSRELTLALIKALEDYMKFHEPKL